MLILVLLLIFAVIIWFEVPSLIKKQMWGELIVFSVLIVLGMVMSIAQTLGIKLPNPTKGIELIFKPLADLLKS